MPVYTVHEPPPRRGEIATDPARFTFVRDGFSFWAFLFGPVWMLWHRLWLGLTAYVVVMAALQLALVKGGASGSVRSLIGLLLAILVGFEAPSLRRWTLNRRGWSHLGVVVADGLELAERRFFDAWVAGAPPASMASAPPARRTASDVIGLFPQPGARP